MGKNRNQMIQSRGTEMPTTWVPSLLQHAAVQSLGFRAKRNNSRLGSVTCQLHEPMATGLLSTTGASLIGQRTEITQDTSSSSVDPLYMLAPTLLISPE